VTHTKTGKMFRALGIPLKEVFTTFKKSSPPPPLRTAHVFMRQTSLWHVPILCIMTGALGFDFRRGLGIFLFTIACRPALGPTQPPIHGYQKFFPWG